MWTVMRTVTEWPLHDAHARHPLLSAPQGFLASLLTGVAEPVGGLLGFALLAGSGGFSSPLMFALVFGLVAGMMVYISIRELLPTALRYDPSDRYATLGFFFGSAVMAASLLLFKI